jgi:hypothetical protein
MAYGYNATTHHTWGSIRAGKQSRPALHRDPAAVQNDRDWKALHGYAGASRIERKAAFDRLQAQGLAK